MEIAFFNEHFFMKKYFSKYVIQSKNIYWNKICVKKMEFLNFTFSSHAMLTFCLKMVFTLFTKNYVQSVEK